MIYDYIYQLISTLFVDPTTLSATGQLILELLMLYLAALVLKFMFAPVALMFKIAAAQFKAVGGPKIRIRPRSFNKDE